MKLLSRTKFPFSALTIISMIAGTTIIRTFLENFSNPEPIGGFTSFLLIINYFLFYSAVVVSLGILIGIITKQSWMKTTSMMVMGLPIIWIAPIIDMIVSGGACMAYISSTGIELIKDIAIIFRPLSHCGATIGIRVEIAIIALAIGRYIFKKKQSAIWGIIGAIIGYLIIWIHSAMPGIIQTIAGISDASFFRSFLGNSLLGSIHSFSFAIGDARFVEQIAFFMGRIPWTMLIILIGLVAFHEYKNQVIAWLRHSQITRISYYALLAISGMIMAIKISSASFPTAFPDLLAIVIFFICIIINGWIAIACNDIADVAIDRVSNPDRPFVSGIFTLSNIYQLIGVGSALLITGALLLNWNVAVLIAVAQVCYLAYSLPPLRMKRHYLTSSFLVGCAGLATLLSGYFMIAPDQTFVVLPGAALVVIFITLALVSNVKDFKDVAGDALQGIKTMPVVFGTKKAGMILSGIIIVWIGVVALIVRSWVIAGFIAPVVILDIMVRKRVPEYVRFLILFAEIILLWIVV